MVNYDKDNMSEECIKKVQPLYDSEMFDPDIIKKASIAAMGICKWVRAMVVYDKVAKEVGPKRAKLAKAEKSASDAMELLATKKAELAEVIALVDKLVTQLNDAKNKLEELQKNSDDCRAKLVRAEKLITGLGGEKAAWTQNSAKLGKDYTNLTGDILIASGIMAYLGCFTGVYRKEACDRWLARLTELQIPASAEFSLSNCIGDPVKIRKWVIDKLPNDSLSIDNAIILHSSRRWPLMIDPQNQANKWVKTMHGAGLKIFRLNQNYARQLETCISFGNPVLIENIGLTIDAMLDPLLLKATFKQGSQEMIRLGDSTVEYSKDFKLYFTTKLPNPHYAPEICVAACLLNFMATVDGLTDAMLGILVAKEEPEIEESRVRLVIESAQSKAELAEIENKILALLSASSGDILEDEELINTLASSKITSTRIGEQVKVQEMTAANIAQTRLSYTPHSFRCSALFFVVADLRTVDPMYEFSLDWFVVQFNTSIDMAEAKESKDDRLQELFRSCLARLYDMVCRSLFAKDKLLYSLMLCLKCMETDKELNLGQLTMLLTCVPGGATDPKPENSDWLTDVSWARVNTLTTLGDVFEGFMADFAGNLDGWKAVFDSEDPMAAEVEWPKNMKAKCNPLQRALVMFALRTDAVVVALQEVVLAKLGKEYLLVPPFDLPTWFKDSSPAVPLIFILSSGSDPMADVTNLAMKYDMLSKIVPISLGQGQGPKATAGIKDGSANGKWVLLQNCHLGVSYMPILEGMIEAWKPDDLNPDFRLWLTACPSPDFPIAILQGGIKMTIEPPKGLRNSLQRAYRGMDEEWFESSTKPRTFKKLLFGLCFFHGLILERRAFGPIGWNVAYGFSEPDLDISQKQLRNFLEDFSDIPYAALNYMVAEANYGGRVTDGQDRRLIVEIIKDFYTPQVLDDDYRFSISGIYYSPVANTIQEHLAYVESLPLNHTPEVFWLHPNASLTASINEGVSILKNALLLMASFGGGGGGDDEDEGAAAMTPEQRYSAAAEGVLATFPEAFDMGATMRKYPVKYEQCLNTVLLNELVKFIKLYNKIYDTCVNLGKAVKGLVIFSPELEEVANGFLTNAIPGAWLGVSYPSLKPAMSYVDDFFKRCKFMDDWIKQGIPNTFWFSAFFFQQAYLTGVLQNFARSASIAIDKLMWNFEVLKSSITDPEPPERGGYIRGLYMQGARWDDETMTLQDSFPKVLWSTVPLLWLKPVEKDKDEHDYPAMYANPVYKCSDRRGVLSTSGHSSNFIMFMYMPADTTQGHNENFWTKRGVAMISQTDD
ncbi:unnamed protein product [Amoebophrya sp. A25]|nr:unnamed protein product [Amoebophrya sp. A25]|eukprot:GSA25T00025007001.1